jgi:Xaa-Pro aminopeptidase
MEAHVWFDTETLHARRERAARSLGDTGPIVVVGAGEPIGKPGGHDQTYEFIPHPEYMWLTGARRPGGAVVYVPGQGFTDFVIPASADERLWEGEPEIPEGRDIASLRAFLDENGRGREVVRLGSLVDETAHLVPASADVRARMDHARRPKDDAEISLYTRAVDATVRGHARAREVTRPGVTERFIQIELEAEMFRAGAERTGYGTIVGAGENAAVLHFSPSSRVVGEKDLVLVDAGAEIAGYTADVTRTYAATGTFTPEQQAIYDAVLAAQLAGIALLKPGTEWHDVHRATARVLALALVDLGLLNGEIDGLLESEAIALFYPHGVGHMVGLGVRDVGGRAPGRETPRMCCGARPRVDMALEEGFLMTVEPGLYFVPAILDDEARRARFKDAVSWSKLDRWRGLGGARIEDDVLVTREGPRVLTAAIPK